MPLSREANLIGTSILALVAVLLPFLRQELAEPLEFEKDDPEIPERIPLALACR